jgi:hypothetical protein
MSYEDSERRASNAGPIPPAAVVDERNIIEVSRQELDLLLSALLAYAPSRGPHGPSHREVDSLIARLKGW